MASTTTKSFLRGLRDGTPFLVVTVPFAMLFGVLATEAGLTSNETIWFSVVVIAGAAQFTALQLMADNAPVAMVLATALAVNLRMAMYSAALVPHLGTAPLWQRALLSYVLVDQSYAASIMEFERRPDMTLAEKLAYFIGVVAPVCPTWYAVHLGRRASLARRSPRRSRSTSRCRSRSSPSSRRCSGPRRMSPRR